MIRPGAKIAGPATKIAILVISAGLTVLSWWHPVKLGGLGWLGAAFAGPIVAMLMVWALLFPEPDNKIVFGRPPEQNLSPGRWEKLLVVLAIGIAVIHGSIWTYVNLR